MTIPALWTADNVAGIASAPIACAPLLNEADIVPVAKDLGIWDAWPVQARDGNPIVFERGDTLWMALAAPRFPNPDDRHGHARIHLFSRTGNSWRHLGPALPDNFSPGSREWSGSAVFDPETSVVTLYFTAAGRRGETTPTFEQRLFAAQADLLQEGVETRCTHWRNLREIIRRDPAYYMTTESKQGGIGTMKAFRDPAYFQDPVSGGHYLLFAGSHAGSSSDFNGVIGIASGGTGDTPSEWQIQPPILSADGLNNELERPHVIWRKGLYYLFWSTQGHVFNPAGPIGPTGLYGMVSEKLLEGWRPLNGTGLVFANPPEATAQAYSWLVMPDLSVISFVDQWGPDASSLSPPRFGGTFAPFLKLRLAAEVATLEH